MCHYDDNCSTFYVGLDVFGIWNLIKFNCGVVWIEKESEMECGHHKIRSLLKKEIRHSNQLEFQMLIELSSECVGFGMKSNSKKFEKVSLSKPFSKWWLNGAKQLKLAQFCANWIININSSEDDERHDIKSLCVYAMELITAPKWRGMKKFFPSVSE